MPNQAPGTTQASRIFVGWTALLGLSFGLRFGMAEVFPNVYHPDEIFQVLEPAHRLAYGYGVIAWEWLVGARSWVLPAFMAVVMRATDWLGAGSSGYLAGVAAFCSLLSLTAVWFACVWARRASGIPAARIAAVACATSFGLIFFATQLNFEVVATHLLLPGLYLGAYAEGNHEKKRLFLAGILCGFAASLRIQLIPAAFVAAIYFCYPRWRERWLAVLAGLALPVLLFGVVDDLTWSYPWQSAVVYFRENAILGRAAESGTGPWYYYGLVLLLLVGPAVLFLWHGARRSSILAVIGLVVLVSHSCIGHKEVRYLYPVIPIALTLASIGIVEFQSNSTFKFIRSLTPRAVLATGICFMLLSSVSTAILCAHWLKPKGPVLTFDWLSKQPGVCGVGVFHVDWFRTGGQAHLHQNVPILLLPDSTRLSADAGSFNALVAREGIASLPPSFSLSKCMGGFCVFQRPGPCLPPPQSDEINAVIRQQEEARASRPKPSY